MLPECNYVIRFEKKKYVDFKVQVDFRNVLFISLYCIGLFYNKYLKVMLGVFFFKFLTHLIHFLHLNFFHFIYGNINI